MTIGTTYNINIEEISPTLDFIAVTRGYSATSPIVLRLPPVTAHKRPIFIKLGRNTTASNDGVWIITRGDSFIEFAERETQTFYIGATPVVLNHSGAVFIGGQSANGTAVNYPCITLFSDGSNWYVANYYPMHTSFGNNQFSLAGSSDNPSGNKLRTANASGVNIFKNNLTGRDTGNNMVSLPTPASSSICMVVYGGNQGTRKSTNALIIKDIRAGSWIDGFSANNPCILVDEDNDGGNAKSTGIVLFYDTTGAGKWYVIGWYYPTIWTFGNVEGSGPGAYGAIAGFWPMKDLATPAGEERKICVVPDIDGARFFTLPTSTATNPQVIIFKAKNIPTINDTRGIRYSTQYFSTTNSNRINSATISIKYGSPDSSNATSKYSCVWFVSEQVSGEAFLRYYPVVGYVPFP
jgi:hypothetical protein